MATVAAGIVIIDFPFQLYIQYFINEAKERHYISSEFVTVSKSHMMVRFGIDLIKWCIAFPTLVTLLTLVLNYISVWYVTVPPTLTLLNCLRRRNLMFATPVKVDSTEFVSF
jgi:hypothetical protein